MAIIPTERNKTEFHIKAIAKVANLHPAVIEALAEYVASQYKIGFAEGADRQFKASVEERKAGCDCCKRLEGIY